MFYVCQALWVLLFCKDKCFGSIQNKCTQSPPFRKQFWMKKSTPWKFCNWPMNGPNFVTEQWMIQIFWNRCLCVCLIEVIKLICICPVQIQFPILCSISEMNQTTTTHISNTLKCAPSIVNVVILQMGGLYSWSQMLTILQTILNEEIHALKIL